MKENSTKILSSAAAFIFSFGLTVMPVQANITITPGNIPQTDEQILFNKPGLIQTGQTVTGISNQTDFIVTFFSQTVLKTPAGGQARIEANNGGTFADLKIDLQDPLAFFTSAIFNIDATVNGQVSITAFAQGGTPFALGSPFTVGGAGQNFFTVTSSTGRLIDYIQITAFNGGLTGLRFDDTSQVRIGGLQVVPEPGFYGVMALGMSGLFWFAYRRKQLAS